GRLTSPRFPCPTLFRSRQGLRALRGLPAPAGGRAGARFGAVRAPDTLGRRGDLVERAAAERAVRLRGEHVDRVAGRLVAPLEEQDRKSTRLNSSHVKSS